MPWVYGACRGSMVHAVGLWCMPWVYGACRGSMGNAVGLWYVRGHLDACWHLDTPLPVAMDRLAQRHMQAWGFSRQQADERIATNDGLNARLVADSAACADFLIRP
jgi:hypothetical protein